MNSADRAALAANPSRRRLLAGAVAAVAATTGGGLLSACSSGKGGSTAKGGVAGNDTLASVLPAYAASAVVTPDIPSVNGSTPAFLKFPAELKASVANKPGKGGSYTFFTPLWGADPGSGSKYFAAMDDALGIKVKWQLQDGVTYQDKLGAVLAGDNVPDLFCIPGWNILGQIPNAIGAKAADLGPYLSGEKVKKYPNLAAIPTGAWQMCVFGGKLRGLPMPNRPLGGVVPYYRADLLEAKGITRLPKTADEFLALAKDLTSADAKVWACDDMWWTAQVLFNLVPGSMPNYWKQDGGRLVHRIETPEYLEALAWTQKLYAQGSVHPDAVAGKTNDAKTRFTSGQTLFMNDGDVMRGMMNEQAKANPKFRMKPMDFFAHDGGKLELYVGQPAGIFSFLSAKLSGAQIEELLGVADFAAAPFGSKEFLLEKFGVEGLHYTKDASGTPVQTELGTKEVVSSYEFVASPAPAIAWPDQPQAATDFANWMGRMMAFGKKPMFYGMQVQEPTRLASLYTRFKDIENDVVRGRKKIGDMQDEVANWKKNGGDELRAFYQDILDKNGSGS
ncbi:extracellular solute-binding protein [Kitasatospora terrestris]|uniref:Extracellular solute-binding protein n=1 Tax=Kitasatospora terrestris TaxID=258051 RepID=A0ABP9DMH4_9ACTN